MRYAGGGECGYAGGGGREVVERERERERERGRSYSAF